ncbi:MAG TPA: hypothetical protein VFR40_09475 [Lapillicoccus sp.]|nr:hypothetical protein [Lapillicoccus sp.]
MSVPSRSRRITRTTLAVVIVTLGVLGGCVDAEPTVDQVDATTSVPGLSLTPVDGGTGYYEKFANPMSSSVSFFPIGVWLESVTSSEDVLLDQSAGLNTYVGLTPDSDLSLVRSAGMNAIHDGGPADVGSETTGWLLQDEADMWAGPGDAEWTGHESGSVCVPSSSACGYTVMSTLNDRRPADGRLRYANYGKGVLFWETDSEAARFVNRYQQLTSADAYFYSDDDLCDATQGGFLLGYGRALTSAECRRASNYGRVVDRVRGLVSPAGRMPVWAYVELGHPGTTGGQITPDQAAAAVWSSLIHGARGIVYFNHSFGGTCPTHHLLRDPCYADIRSRISALNAQITRLAPALNAPRVDGLTSVTGGVDALTTWSNGTFYVFAGNQTVASTSARFSLPCVGDATVTVLDEGRTIPMSDGAFSDDFADDTSYHLYRIDGGRACGLR